MKLEQVLEKEPKRVLLLSKEDIEKLLAEKKQYEQVEVSEKPKKQKKALLKLIKKAKYNPKVHEELIPINKVKRPIHRNWGVY